MSLARFRNTRDSIEPDVVDALERIGAGYVRLNQAGVGDLLIGFRGINFMVECKAPKGKLTPAQQEFHMTWPGQIAVCRSVDEVLALICSVPPELDDAA